MVILITGSSGFIGRHLAAELRARGHRVIGGARSGGPDTVQADFSTDLDPEVWIPRLTGVDVVINAVGILREHGAQTFSAVHTKAPQALFAACARTGVARVIQISALGADNGTSSYFRSKHLADEYLRSLPLDWTIVQPSLVYGSGGTSAKMFTLFASLPFIGVPGNGEQPVQPIHIDDLVAVIVRIVDGGAPRRTVPLVGPRSMSYRDMLQALRTGMGLGRAVILPVPTSLMRLGARIAELSPRSLLDRETLAMLEAGNVADPTPTTHLLQGPARDVAAFVEKESRLATRQQAQLLWLLPLLRVSIAAVWIWTAVVSFGLFPREQSLDLLYRTGVPAALAPLMLYGAAALDLVFGIATLAMRRRRWLWVAQMTLILTYTVIITFKLPEFWLHPYGPMVKNLPMLAALYLLYVLEKPHIQSPRP